ncbi:MAG: LIVCS family branched-chain amino acid:cation transporter, partial [Dokdonia sp.]
SLSLKGVPKEESRSVIAKAGLFAGLGFVVIYVGMIALGASNSGTLDISNRTELLNLLSYNTLGGMGRTALGVLVALACFTTAVGIVTGTADFFKGLFNDSRKAYIVTAVISCVLGVVMGQLDVHSIIVVALPALMFIYPITIVLILLNAIPEKYASALVFRGAVLITFVFSIPDFIRKLKIVNTPENPDTPLSVFGEWIKNLQMEMELVVAKIPLIIHEFEWLVPALLTFVVINVVGLLRKKS